MNSVAAAQLSATEPEAASTPRAKGVTGAHLQTLLARSGFSPGLIDGKPGRKTKLATQHFQRSKHLEESGVVDEATSAALAAFEPSPASVSASRGADEAAAVPMDGGWTRRYVVSSADVALITGPIPTDWNERAALEVSGYENALDLLAERGWCSVEMVRQLNPGTDFEKVEPGQEVVLPHVATKGLAKIARLEIDLAEKLVLGYDGEDALVTMTHCSIAADMANAPVGELRVKVVVTDPDYTFNPESWPEVDNVFSKLRIAPGPRNPVGAAWIGLDKPGYGIHGTVRPQDIGKTGSHGCFRLANWDAVRLAKAVTTETVVQVRE